MIQTLLPMRLDFLSVCHLVMPFKTIPGKLYCQLFLSQSIKFEEKISTKVFNEIMLFFVMSWTTEAIQFGYIFRQFCIKWPKNSFYEKSNFTANIVLLVNLERFLGIYIYLYIYFFYTGIQF